MQSLPITQIALRIWYMNVLSSNFWQMLVSDLGGPDLIMAIFIKKWLKMAFKSNFSQKLRKQTKPKIRFYIV